MIFFLYLQVDILDTSGDMQFPAMRRLSIATAHAFMLVYASTSASSFECVKQCFEEIREQRADYQVSLVVCRLFLKTITARQLKCVSMTYGLLQYMAPWLKDSIFL